MFIWKFIRACVLYEKNVTFSPTDNYVEMFNINLLRLHCVPGVLGIATSCFRDCDIRGENMDH